MRRVAMNAKSRAGSFGSNRANYVVHKKREALKPLLFCLDYIQIQVSIHSPEGETFEYDQIQISILSSTR